MVIQSNMKIVDIVELWGSTKLIFEKYGISVNSENILRDVGFTDSDLSKLLMELNEEVGSSEITCIEGG